MSSSSSSSPLKAFLVYGLVTGLKFSQLGAVDAHHREHKVHNIVLYPDKHSWCKTTTIKQVVNYPGCTSVEIDNNVCVGGCFSYSIPHMEPSDPSEVIVPYCDSCQPSETAWRQVTLKCDDDKNDPETPSHLVKHVQIIQNCSCTPCERNHYKSSSKDLFVGSGVVDFGAGNYDDPANDLLLMQSHQHYVEATVAAPAGDQQQKEPEKDQERGREGQELPPEADGKPDAVDSLQMRAKENASGAIPAAAAAASTIPSSNSTMASSEPPSISDETPPDSQDPATLQTTTTTTTTTPSPPSPPSPPSSPPTTVTSRWKKMYALTYALIRKVQLNNTRHDREQLVDLLNLMKTTKPGIADFVEILRRDRPLEPHEIQHLNEILTRIDPAKHYKKHVAGAGVGVEKQQQQQHNPHQQRRHHHHHHQQHLPEEARMEDDNDEHEKQTQEEEEQEEDEEGEGEDEVEHKDDEEMEVEKVEEVEEEQEPQPQPELEPDVDSDEIPAKVTTISDDQSPGAGGGGHHSSAEGEALPAAERQHQTVVEEEEEEAVVKATLVTLAGGGDEKDDKNSSSSHEIEPHHPHHPHHTHPHPHHHHHHVNENIVPHGHLTRGPHGALVIKPDSSDRVHEKLDVNAHELKPNHAGTLLSYHSHSGESKKP